MDNWSKSYDANEVLSFMTGEGILNPVFNIFYISTFIPGHNFDYHFYEDMIEIVFVLRGSSYLIIDNQYMKIKKNDCLVIYPKTVHNFFLKKNESCSIINLIFNPGKTGVFAQNSRLINELRFLYEYKNAKIKYFRFVDSIDIRACLERLYKSLNKDCGVSPVTKLYYMELCLNISKILNENFEIIAMAKNKHLSDALDFILSFYSTKITVDDIAKHAGISARQLSRIFSGEFGMSVQDYLNIFRIDRAKEMLKNKDANITDIAFNLGYSSSQYFATCFKRILHMTPGEYRNNLPEE